MSANSSSLEKRRPGRKGNFQGQRLELLESLLPEWDKARVSRCTGDFWTTVTGLYWKKFHWRLEKNEEPSGDPPADEELSQEDLEAKAAKISLVEGQIRSYYNNKRNQARMKSNVFAAWLAGLRKPPGLPPKLKSPHQFYMGHIQYRDKVTREYKKRYPSGLLGADSIKVRCEIAQQLLAEEPVEVRETLRKEAAEELAAAKEYYYEAKKGLPSDVPEDVREARENLAHVVQPLIDGIRMFTKASVTVLIGSPPDATGDNYFVKVLNSGKTLDGKDFHDWDREGFKTSVLQQFVRFLSQTSDGTVPTTPARSVPASMAFRQQVSASMTSTPHFGLTSAPTINQVSLTRPALTSALTQPVPSSASDSRAPGVPTSPAFPSSAPNTDDVNPFFSSSPPSTPTRSPTEPTRVIPTPLRNEIASLPGADATKKITALMQLTSYEFLRACNVAKNREVMASLGLHTGKNVNPGNACEDRANDSEDDYIDDIGNKENKHTGKKKGATKSSSHGGGNLPGINPRRSGRLGLKLSSPDVNRSNWPDWLAEKFDHYASLDFGNTWKTTITSWTELERAMGFRSPSSGLPSTHRPDQIAVWNQNRRPIAPSRQPPITNLEMFVDAFYRWWDAINPSWRAREDGRLILGVRESGIWTSLHKPGQNGFLSVLQVLKWWRELLDDTGTREWELALEDVAWVLQEVLKSLSLSMSGTSTLSHKRPHDSIDSATADDPTNLAPNGVESPLPNQAALGSKRQKTVTPESS